MDTQQLRLVYEDTIKQDINWKFMYQITELEKWKWQRKKLSKDKSLISHLGNSKQILLCKSTKLEVMDSIPIDAHPLDDIRWERNCIMSVSNRRGIRILYLYTRWVLENVYLQGAWGISPSKEAFATIGLGWEKMFWNRPYEKHRATKLIQFFSN